MPAPSIQIVAAYAQAIAPEPEVVPIVALSGFAPASYFRTQVGGGEAGVATGFGALMLGYIHKMPAAGGGAIFGRGHGSGTTGYVVHADVNALMFQTGTGSTNVVAPAPFRASDIGSMSAVLFRQTPTATECWISGVFRGIAPNATYAPTSNVSDMGNWSAAPNNYALTFMHLCSVVTFRGTLTDAQLKDLFLQTRLLGDVPATIDGATVTHRWSLRDAIVVEQTADGDLAPAVIPDSVTLATVDQMTRQGSPVVRVIDPGVDGLTNHGIIGLSGASYLISQTNAGLRGSISFHVKWFGRIDQISAVIQILVASTNSGSPGWQIYLQGSGVISATMRMQDGETYSTSIASSPTNTITASDVGQKRLIILQAKDGYLRLYWKSVVVAESVMVGSVITGSQAFTIGTRAAFDLGCVHTFIDCEGSDTQTLTDAEIAECFATTEATGRLHSIKANHRWSPDLQIQRVEDGIPAQVLDRIGTDHLTRVGTGLQVAQRTERLWSYETSPIMHGLDALTLADYYESSVNGMMPGVHGAFWASVAFIVTAQTGTAGQRFLLSALDTTAPLKGFDIETGGMNNTIRAITYHDESVSTGNNGTSIASIAAADVGRVQVFTFSLSLSTLYAWYKRAAVSAGVAYGGVYRPAAKNVAIGRHNDGAYYPATGLQVLGFAYGVGALSLGQAQAHCDAVMANEAMVSMPGADTKVLVDIGTDVRDAGGVLPATLLNRAVGGVGSFVRRGNPQLASVHARAFGW